MVRLYVRTMMQKLKTTRREKNQWLQDHKTKPPPQSEVEIKQGVPEAAQPEEQEEPEYYYDYPAR